MPLKPTEKKLYTYLMIIFVMFSVLLGRLAYLQLFQAEEFNLLAQSNRIRLVTVPAARGEILDTHGEVIARSRPSFAVSLALLDLKNQDQEEVFTRLAEILQIPVEEITDAVKKQPLKYEPVRILSDVPFELVSQIEEHRMQLPGVIIEVEPIREYIHGDFLSHVLGYVRQNENLLASLQEKYPEEEYKSGDRFGIAGIERWYEPILHGLDGARQVEVDARIRPVRELGLREPIPGNNLILTIDRKIQAAAEQALERVMLEAQKEFPDAKASAVVVMDIKTGAIITMASKPSFDPNRFNKPIPKEEWAASFSDELPFPPLLNRALRPYAPGSTFKMVTAAAVIESGKFTPKTRVYDPGYYQLGNRRFKCWFVSGHGQVDLVRSLAVSCNTYYFTAGLAVGNAEIARYAKEFGLGSKTGITLPAEAAGTVPTAEWKKATNTSILEWRYETIFAEIEKRYNDLIKAATTESEKERLQKEKERELSRAEADFKRELDWNTRWHAFDTLNMSIGQGASYYTPIQLVNMTAAIANGGTLYKPYLVKQITNHQGKVVEETKPEVMKKVDVSPETMNWLREGMNAVTNPGGTAYGRFAGFPVKVAGKTGTAQVAGKDNHGLFVGFAPYDKPEVAIAAVVEHGGAGGATAGVIAREVLSAYFKVNEEPVSPLGPATPE